MSYSRSMKGPRHWAVGNQHAKGRKSKPKGMDSNVYHGPWVPKEGIQMMTDLTYLMEAIGELGHLQDTVSGEVYVTIIRTHARTLAGYRPPHRL